MDSAFDEVMGHCAQRQGISGRQGSGTWIVPAMRQAYGQWHRMGHVHSVETWIQGRLVGGLYVVELGKMVFGESMFSLQPDASKIALCALVAKCRAEDIRLIDCQQNTSHLASLGAREISRLQFESHLRDAIGPVGTNTSRISPPWSYDVGLWDLLDRDDE
jgi:leucyl/phenylalanyl-tRNA--protein transferase